MRRQDLLRLAILGALEPASQVTSELVRDAGPRAVQLIRWQKSLGLSAQRLADLARRTGDPAIADLHAAIAPAAREGRERVARLASVDAHIVALGQARTYPIKGLALRAWYAESSHRDVGDLDLWIPDVDEAWRLTRALRREGWVYQDNELPWFKRDVRGQLYGQIRLWAGVEQPDVYADIHYGPFYSVRHCAVLRLREPDGGRVMAPAENLAMMVGNAANDHFITVKDVNDMYLALDRDDVDWERLLATLRGARIERFFALMVDRLHRCTRLDERRRERLRMLRLPRWREFPGPLPTEWSWRRRWMTTVVHAGRTARATAGLPVVRTVGGAAWYYARPLRLRLVDAVRRPLRVDVADNARCVRLVPPEQVAAGAGALPPAAPSRAEARPLPGCQTIDVVSLPHGDVVSCGPDRFLPTVDYAIDRRLVAELGQVRANGAATGDDAGSVDGAAAVPEAAGGEA